MFLSSSNCSGVYPSSQIRAFRSLIIVPVARLQFSSPKHPDKIWDPPSSNSTGTDCSVPGTNWPEHEAVYSSPPCAVRRAIWPSTDLTSYFCLYVYVFSLLSRDLKLLFYCTVFRLYLPLFVVVAFHNGCRVLLSCLAFLLMSHLERYFSLSPTVPSLLPFY